jgi:hypothetical protein
MTPKSLGGMGFQDFVLFNQAMLGKQCWRLLTELDSLCARVLKGRYFLETSFLSVVKPRSTSYTWRSILFGRDLLVQGIRWNVGNGECIKIMQDNWIPDYPVGTFTTLEVLPEDAKVEFLFVRIYVQYDMSRIEIDLVSCLALQDGPCTSIYTRPRDSIIHPLYSANLSPSLSFYMVSERCRSLT